MGKLPDDAIGIELDGNGVSPETVDAKSTLRLTLAFLDLVAAIANDREQPLVFRGLEIEDKCAAVFSRVDRPAVSKQCTSSAVGMIDGSEKIPRGFAGKVEEARTAFALIPAGHSVVVFSGKTRRALGQSKQRQGSPYATISLRAEVVRVGGSDPTATFKSASEPRAFTLRVPKDKARDLAKQLYEEVDIEASVLRDDEDVIESGSLLDFHPLVDDPLAAWSDFVRDGLSNRQH